MQATISEFSFTQLHIFRHLASLIPIPNAAQQQPNICTYEFPLPRNMYCICTCLAFPQLIPSRLRSYEPLFPALPILLAINPKRHLLRFNSSSTDSYSYKHMKTIEKQMANTLKFAYYFNSFSVSSNLFFLFRVYLAKKFHLT